MTYTRQETKVARAILNVARVYALRDEQIRWARNVLGRQQDQARTLERTTELAPGVVVREADARR